MRVEDMKRSAERGGDGAGLLKARLRAGEVEEAALKALALLGHEDASMVLGVDLGQAPLAKRVHTLLPVLERLPLPEFPCGCGSTSTLDAPCDDCDRTGFLTPNPSHWWGVVLAARCGRECLGRWRCESLTMNPTNSTGASVGLWEGSMTNAEIALAAVEGWIKHPDGDWRRLSMGVGSDIATWAIGGMIFLVTLSPQAFAGALLECAKALSGHGACHSCSDLSAAARILAGETPCPARCSCRGEELVLSQCRDEIERRLL